MLRIFLKTNVNHPHWECPASLGQAGRLSTPICQTRSGSKVSLLPYSRSIALPEKVQASLSSPLFASIALASRSKEAGLSSLPPGASRSQRRFISSSISSISIFYLIVLQLCWLPAHTHTRVPDTKSETRKLKFSIQFNFQRTILLRMLAWRGSSNNCDSTQESSAEFKCLLTWTTWTLPNLIWPSLTYLNSIPLLQ